MAMGNYSNMDFVGFNGPLDFVGANGSVATFANPAVMARPSLGNALAALTAAQGANMVDAQTMAKVAAQAAQNALAAVQPAGLPPNTEMLSGGRGGIVRDQYIGLGPRVTIAAGASQLITAQPQRPCRIRRIVIESLIAGGSGKDFVVSQLNIGVEPQIVGAAELPGSMFASDGFQVDVKTDTANVGNTITILITNTTAGAITLALGAVGLTLT